jgi:trehalose 6-phosphate synthase
MRLIVCSNSAPRWQEDVGLLPRSPGGLVPLLVTLLDGGGDWVCTAPSGGSPTGPAGLPPASAGGDPVTVSVLPGGVTLHQVRQPDQVIQQHYLDIGVRLMLWLFHYLLDTAAQPVFDRQFAQAWTSFEAVNRAYASHLATILANSPDELVLINDYHLFLLPEMLAPGAGRRGQLAFFHGLPWCEPDYFGILPAAIRDRILASLLRCDVVGFHCTRWARAFAACCARYLPGCEVTDNSAPHNSAPHNSAPDNSATDNSATDNSATDLSATDLSATDLSATDLSATDISVRLGEHRTRLAVAPFPLDIEVVERMRSDPATAHWQERLSATQGDRRVITRADRIDLWKNLPRGFAAYQSLLESRPGLARDWWFCAVATTPSRTTERSRELQRTCEDMVASLNERFGAPGQPAVSLVYPDLATTRNCVVAALSRSDLTLVNPTFDGMNLVAKEALYLGERAPLLLSQNAGAHEQLARCVTALQPFDVEGTAAILTDAMNGGIPARAEAGRRLLSGQNAAGWLAQLVGPALVGSALVSPALISPAMAEPVRRQA